MGAVISNISIHKTSTDTLQATSEKDLSVPCVITVMTKRDCSNTTWLCIKTSQDIPANTAALDLNIITKFIDTDKSASKLCLQAPWITTRL